MSNNTDYYQILGIEHNASYEEIRSAYHKLVLKYHPDKNQDDPYAESKFREISRAYETLSDTTKREHYDRTIFISGIICSDTHIFSALQEMIDPKIFAVLSETTPYQKRKLRGYHIHCSISMEFLETATPKQKIVTINRREFCSSCHGLGCASGFSYKTCQNCKGHGKIQQNQDYFILQMTCQICNGQGQVPEKSCESCQGHGYIVKQNELLVQIPAGIADGMHIKIAGEGESLLPDVPPGDVYCEVHVQPHPLFSRQNDNVILQLPISFSQAALGAKIEIPTLYGMTKLTIPAGTQNGDILTIRGLGFPNIRGRGKGDQLVQINIEVPHQLTQEQRQLLEKFATTEEQNISPKRQIFYRQAYEQKDKDIPPKSAKKK